VRCSDHRRPGRQREIEGFHRVHALSAWDSIDRFILWMNPIDADDASESRLPAELRRRRAGVVRPSCPVAILGRRSIRRMR
jgi:hypothetical protein